MRFSVVLAALVASASASSFLSARQSLPGCLTQCIAKSDLDGCAASDNACLCKSAVFVDGTTDCINSTCTGDDIAASIKASTDLCLAVGVSTTPGPTSSGSASSTGTGSSSASSTGKPSGSANSTNSASSTGTSSTGAPAPSNATSDALANGANTFFLAAIAVAALAL